MLGRTKKCFAVQGKQDRATQQFRFTFFIHVEQRSDAVLEPVNRLSDLGYQDFAGASYRHHRCLSAFFSSESSC
jgi:hypothetical protein